jgi:hypothetical protein
MVLNIDMLRSRNTRAATTDPETGPRAPRSVRWCASLAGIAVAFAALGTLFSVLGLVSAARDPEVSRTVLEYEEGVDPDTGVAVGVQEVTIIDDDVTGLQSALSQIDHVLESLFVFGGASLVLLIFARSSDARPFDRRNVRDLRVLALLVAVGGTLLEPLHDLAMRFATDGTAVPQPSVQFPPLLSLAIALGLVFWALSVIFEYGADLAEESAATI